MTNKTKKRKRDTKTGLVKKKRKINDNSIQENKITERNTWCSSVKYISPFMTSVSFEEMNTLRRKNKSYDSYLKRTTKNSWFSVIHDLSFGACTFHRLACCKLQSIQDHPAPFHLFHSTHKNNHSGEGNIQ